MKKVAIIGDTGLEQTRTGDLAQAKFVNEQPVLIDDTRVKSAPLSPTSEEILKQRASLDYDEYISQIEKGKSARNIRREQARKLKPKYR